MLALDSTMGCIEASEPDVVDLYRSAPLTFQESGRPETREAYVCAIRKKKAVQVYAALVVDNARIFVYTPSGGSDSEESYHLNLEQALIFVRSMGFAPEQVHLNYSPAMREVVVRNIKILRPPGSRVHALLKHATAAPPSIQTPPPAQGSPSAVQAPPPSAHTPQSSDQAPQSSIQEPEPSAQTSQASDTAPSPATVAGRTAARIASAHKAPPVAAQVPMPAPVGQLHTAEAVGDSVILGGGAALRAEESAGIAALQAALARLEEEHSALKRRAEEESAALKRKLARALSECDKGKELLASARSRLAERQGLREETEAETVSALRAELAEVCATRDAASARVQECTGQQLATGRELAAVSQELAIANQELAIANQGLATANQDLATASRELDAVSRERDALRAEKEQQAIRIATLESESADLPGLRNQVSAASARIEELERHNRELSLGEAGQAEASELQRQEMAALAQEQDQARRQARKLAAGRQEAGSRPGLSAPPGVAAPPAVQGADGTEPAAGSAWFLERSLAASWYEELQDTDPAHEEWVPVPGDLGPVAESPASLEPADRGVTLPKADWDAGWYHAPAGKQPVQVAHGSEDAFFARQDEPGGGSGRFQLQAGVTRIECASPAEVLELHQSVNVAQVSPDGKVPITCLGYICSVTSATGATLVAVALSNAQSGRTWIYLPEVQPSDETAYQQTLKGAIAFAEEVGFIMERLKLGGNNQAAALRRCPVLLFRDGK